jgi:hypothetical protein
MVAMVLPISRAASSRAVIERVFITMVRPLISVLVAPRAPSVVPSRLDPAFRSTASASLAVAPAWPASPTCRRAKFGPWTPVAAARALLVM